MVHFQGSSWLTKQKGIALKTKLISKEQPGPSRISLNKLLLIYLHWLKTPLLSFSKGSELHNKHLQRLRLLPKKKSTAESESDMMPSQKHNWDRVATGIRKPARVSLWKGRESHKAVPSCSFALSYPDLSISQIITFCPHPYSAS